MTQARFRQANDETYVLACATSASTQTRPHKRMRSPTHTSAQAQAHVHAHSHTRTRTRTRTRHAFRQVAPLFATALWGQEPSREVAGAIASYATYGAACAQSQVLAELPLVPGPGGGRLAGVHLSNTICLTQVFFKSGE